MTESYQHPSSYRDPSGYIFRYQGTLYRQVNHNYRSNYEKAKSSGLFEKLFNRKLLIPHKEIEKNLTADADWFLTLQPEFIPFISYFYEWSFNMLKDAALLTLQVAREALQHGMVLKDASAYNVQFHQGAMIFIDTLSFEEYDETKPWIAYRQFCEHFLAPLALMHYNGVPLQGLQLGYPDGIPMGIARKLLPGKSRWNLHNYLHLHLHANVSGKAGPQKAAAPFSRKKMDNLLRSLEEAVRQYKLDARSGVWSGYYDEAFSRPDYVPAKKKVIEEWLAKYTFRTAFDAGANEGEFSQLLAQRGIPTISADLDHFSINNLYEKIKGTESPIHPLIINLTHPTPSIGWNDEERSSFTERVSVDLVMALALIHHLSIGSNVPLVSVAAYFHKLAPFLLIEWVPKEDEKVRLMLQSKNDIYTRYTLENFLEAFGQFYEVLERVPDIGGSGRSLFLMKSNAGR